MQFLLKAKLYITFLYCCLFANAIYAQIVPPPQDTIKNSLDFAKLNQPAATTAPARPSPGVAFSVNLDSVEISDDALDDQIDYNAADSMRFDVLTETVHLYGDAVVKYNTLTVSADYIAFNMDSSLVYASGMPDSTGRLSGFPKFEQGEQSFDSKKMRYNFKTNKGIIYDATTTERDLYVLGKRAQFYGKDSLVNRNTDVVYSENAIFTTCSHPNPHFGIRSKKQKVIPDEVVVVGPSNLEVGGVSTPLWLPFAFFPLKEGKRTGLIFPRDYEYSDNWGFGLRGVGWYFPINDYWSLQLTGDIYTRGTWGINANAQYRKRYRYSGDLQLAFADRKRRVFAQKLSERSLSLRWSHRQDGKAHPTNRFSASVNIQTNDYQSLNQNDAQSVLQNTLTSNVSFSKTFPGKPFRFSTSMNHSQNTQNKEVTISFPNFNFDMNRIFPFKRKNVIGNDEKWFEKISLQYKAALQNRFRATDTTLFTQQTLDDARFGVRHTATMNASYRALKFINITPSINYKANWYFDRTVKTLDPVFEIDTVMVEVSPGMFESKFDTLSYGEVIEDEETGFYPLRLFDASINASTQIFGVRQFTKGKIRGIRHVVKPSVSFGYTPDYTTDFWGYFDEVDTDLRDDFNMPSQYSIFENGIYDDAPSSGERMALGYSINNIFEAKYWSKKDSTAKNFKLFDNVIVNGNYNFAADSLRWSAVRLRGTTRLFGGITTLNISSEFDPYALNSEGRKINVFNRDAGGKLLRYVDTNIRISSNITVKQIRNLLGLKKEEKRKPLKQQKPRGQQEEVDASNFSGGFPGTFNNNNDPNVGVLNGQSLLDMLENFRISHNIVMQSEPDTFFIRTNSIQMQGSIQLTDKWSIQVGNIAYDLVQKELVYPSLGFFRDLHCWEMGMNWQPSRDVFSFFLRVRPGSLDFIKVPYGRNNADGFGGF